MARRAPSALAALAVAAPLLLAGCGSDEGSTDAAASPSASSSVAPSSPAASTDASGSPAPGTSPPPPEFCDAAKAFSTSQTSLDSLTAQSTPQQVEAAFASTVDETQALADTAPPDVKPAFTELAASVVRLKDLFASVGYDRSKLDPAKVQEVQPQTSAEESQAVDALVSQCPGIGGSSTPSP